ncbi:MAG TPA: adenylate/guanylate cyclase domain-containing protein [Abditibacteriaceae bacterium]|jgi:predicted ATPase/class 3 adenylate cyclase
MPQLPSGVITLVFTDIEGSSALWESHRDRFAPVLNEHNRLMRAAAAAWNGVEVKTEGDAFFLVFARASNAVAFAVDAQRALAAYDWNKCLAGLDELRVRIGMHSGEPILAAHPDGSADYFGPVVNRAARVGAAGYGGQILVSGVTQTLAQGELSPEITFSDLGAHLLKGVGEEQLWQVHHNELPSRFPALKTPTADKHNLPQSATPFVGREAEVERCSALLREDDVRLLSLLGFGGQGKTRLALQIAASLTDEFADGVWWIELEEARDADAMVARIAHDLRIHLQPQPTVREQVFHFHRDRELLLVLDNTEQIPDAGLVVNELLAAGPRIKCLVTTRRALEIQSERRVQVPPLPLSEAAQLFIQRAQSHDAGFLLSAQTRKEIEQLCASLEGVPLAIELAASRIGVLSPGEMLGRLDERFKLLQRRAPDLPPRQRALRGAIDWSYELLVEDDRELLQQLAVFAGGFSIGAAEAVCDSLDALEGIAELQRHSLLRAETTANAKRFSMLESVRAYAAEKLADASDELPLRKRHANFFLRFAESRSAQLRSPSEATALEEIFVERANLRAALDWAIAHDAPLAARLAVALHEPLYRLGLWKEVRTMLQRGWDTLESSDNTALRAALQLHRASLAYDMGKSDEALTDAEGALEIARAAEDTKTEAAALNLLGLLATDGDDTDAAEQNFRASLALRAESDHNGRAIAFHNLARLASRRGETASARGQYQKALEHRRAAGDMRGEAETLGNLGVIAQNDGDFAAARDFYLQSLSVRYPLRDSIGIGLMLHNLAEIAEIENDEALAVALFIHAERIFRELGSSYAEAPTAALEKLQAKLGAQYKLLFQEAQNTAWEELVPLNYPHESTVEFDRT